MKFLCPNCKAKYRIGPEKMVGRQAAKIRCRKCEFLIQIAYRGNGEEFDVTATPPTAPPQPAPVPAPRLPKGSAAGQPVMAPMPPPNAAPRPLAAGLSIKDEGTASRKPTAAVPGLPGLGSAKSTRGAALMSDAGALQRRPLAPLPPPPMASAGLGAAPAPPAAGSPSGGSSMQAPSAAASMPQAAPAPGVSRPGAGNTQLGDQFRESVQAGGVADDLPQDGWFVGVNGVPLGPIPLADLRELAMAGHIDRRSLVWREGHAEWRPLGKFAGLARVIDDGSGPLATPRPEPAASAPAFASPAASRSNGSAANGHVDTGRNDIGRNDIGRNDIGRSDIGRNDIGRSDTGRSDIGQNDTGHVVTGFDVVRPDTSERPSAWGDLDDEDDEDEQPTTVKGRVSALPNGAAPSPVPSAPPPPVAPLGLPQSSPGPFGFSSSVPAASTATKSSGVHAIASQPPPPEVLDPTLAFGEAPERVDADVGMMRSSGRNRRYLIVVAIVFAFALGAIVTYLMRLPSASDKPSKRASSAEPASGSRRPETDVALTRTIAEDLPQLAVDELVAAPPSVDLEGATESPKPRGGAAAAPSAAAPALASQRARSTAPSSLLAGLASAAVSGPSLGKAEDRASGTGLDAAAIQRTVRRYSPGVRQNCWQRALNARAPGVPSSAKVSATITIDAGGRVQGVTVSGAPRGYPGLGRCIESNVKGWQFPRSDAQTITNVPFMFVGQ